MHIIPVNKYTITEIIMASTSGYEVDLSQAEPQFFGTSGGSQQTPINTVTPTTSRLSASGLRQGGAPSAAIQGAGPNVGVTIITPHNANNPTNSDWRVRISIPTGNGIFYNDPDNQLQQILKSTNGVIFPYTPSVTVTHSARYQEQALTHNNYKNYFYEGSGVDAITISGDFTVQNPSDGMYLLAAIYFFRSATKMFFGGDFLAGNPPPVVFLDGYGDFYFPHVSCVVTSFQHTLPPDVDYVEIPYSQNASASVRSVTSKLKTRLPTTSQLSVTVQPIYSRNNIHNNMTLTDFSRGALLSGNGGFL